MTTIGSGMLIALPIPQHDRDVVLRLIGRQPDADLLAAALGLDGEAA